MATTLRLLDEAHVARRYSNDHFGKKARPDRNSWALGPPQGADDAIRALMLEATLPDGRPRRSSEEKVAYYRIHGCKATLVSAGIHMQQMRGSGDNTTAVRHQGGWCGRLEAHDARHVP